MKQDFNAKNQATTFAPDARMSKRPYTSENKAILKQLNLSSKGPSIISESLKPAGQDADTDSGTMLDENNIL